MISSDGARAPRARCWMPASPGGCGRFAPARYAVFMRFTLSDGVSLHVERAGDPGAPPLLFVHGFPLSGEMWRAASERLSDAACCIVPDLRGHGRSDPIAEVTIARFADDLAELLDRLGERRPVTLCGLSMGGIIAFEYFRSHRRRLRALILCDCRANPESPEGVERREKLAQGVLHRGGVLAAETMLPNLLAPGAPPALVEKYRAMILGTAPSSIAAASRALARRADSCPTLPAIDVPTLVVAGECDAITPPETMREIRRAIPGAALAMIAGAGHVPPDEKPDDFAAAARAFMASLPA